MKYDALNKNVVAALPVVSGLAVFAVYVKYIFYPDCLDLGYTLCAAPGEDFFSLYQGAYNFFNNYYIYGSRAAEHLVIPYYMPMKYFPLTPILWGGPFLLFGNAYSAYRGYLVLSVSLHMGSLYLLYLCSRKLNSSAALFLTAAFLWVAWFPLASEWRMGQFNHLSGIFVLLLVTFILHGEVKGAAASWILSLSWKPTGLFAMPYFLKTKDRAGIALFTILIVLSTAIYVLYHRLSYPGAIDDFLKAAVFLGRRDELRIHYIDNFGVYSFLGELLFDRLPDWYRFAAWVFPAAVLMLYIYISAKIQFNSKETSVYYLLYTLATMIIFHKEVWESWLTLWLPVACLLLFLAGSVREKSFIIANALLLGTPSLFHFWHIYKTPEWRFFMIGEKALPQLLLYGLVIYKLLSTRRIGRLQHVRNGEMS